MRGIYPTPEKPLQTPSRVANQIRNMKEPIFHVLIGTHNLRDGRENQSSAEKDS